MDPRKFIFLVAFAIATSPAHAVVTVTNADPDGFRDAGDRSNDPVKVMQALANHLKSLGARWLAPGVDLAIEVHDVDRAGRTRNNLPNEIRVIGKTNDPPCIDLTYVVSKDGAEQPARRERVCDPNYLRRLDPPYQDSLGYEKRMLDEWFQDRFGTARRAP